MLGVICSGIYVAQYHLTTVSTTSARSLGHFMALTAFLAENATYFFLGTSVIACKYQELAVVHGATVSIDSDGEHAICLHQFVAGLCGTGASFG